MNARRLPSGDQRGDVSLFLCVVNRLGNSPSVDASQMSASVAFCSRSFFVTV